MASFNKIAILGYLGKDPELRNTPQGAQVCSFTIATTEKRKDRAGEMKDETTWFRISVWGRQAEIASQYLSKGKQVWVEGRLRLDEYTDREGNKRSSLEVNASDLQFIGGKAEESGVSEQATDRGAVRRVLSQQAPAIDDDDIPF